jgi:rare lipoprotein A
MMALGRARLLFLGFVGMTLAACSQAQLAVHTVKEIARKNAPAAAPAATESLSPDGVPIGPGGEYKIGRPYVVQGVRYVPGVNPDYDETGIASWYGDAFDGLLTANGEIYDMNALTAAHKTLPLPTYVRVTNLENGRALVVRVNDRGPFVNGRIIDMSRRSAQLLGFERAGTARVRVGVLSRGDDGFIVYRPPTPDDERFAAEAAPVLPVETALLAPPEGVEEAPPREFAADPALSFELITETKMFVQAGAFAEFRNANLLSAKLRRIGEWRITSVVIRGSELYRVRFGPVFTIEEADMILARLIEIGHSEARIVVE